MISSCLYSNLTTIVNCYKHLPIGIIGPPLMADANLPATADGVVGNEENK
jgi:hypothetical protein